MDSQSSSLNLIQYQSSSSSSSSSDDHHHPQNHPQNRKKFQADRKRSCPSSSSSSSSIINDPSLEEEEGRAQRTDNSRTHSAGLSSRSSSSDIAPGSDDGISEAGLVITNNNNNLQKPTQNRHRHNKELNNLHHQSSNQNSPPDQLLMMMTQPNQNDNQTQPTRTIKDDEQDDQDASQNPTSSDMSREPENVRESSRGGKVETGVAADEKDYSSGAQTVSPQRQAIDPVVNPTALSHPNRSQRPSSLLLLDLDLDLDRPLGQDYHKRSPEPTHERGEQRQQQEHQHRRTGDIHSRPNSQAPPPTTTATITTFTSTSSPSDSNTNNQRAISAPIDSAGNSTDNTLDSDNNNNSTSKNNNNNNNNSGRDRDSSSNSCSSNSANNSSSRPTTINNTPTTTPTDSSPVTSPSANTHQQPIIFFDNNTNSNTTSTTNHSQNHSNCGSNNHNSNNSNNNSGNNNNNSINNDNDNINNNNPNNIRTNTKNGSSRRSSLILTSKVIVPKAFRRLSRSLLPSNFFLKTLKSDPKTSDLGTTKNTSSTASTNPRSSYFQPPPTPPQPQPQTQLEHINPNPMNFSSLPSSMTNLPLPNSSDDHHHDSSTTNRRQQRHSFWSGLRQRSSSRLNSTTTLATYPNQQPFRSMTTIDSISKSPSLLGPSRVIAVIGNIRTGIGRMILEELVLRRFIVVALIDKADGNFSRSVEGLAVSPSLFHAFAVEGGLFGREMIDDRSSSINPIHAFQSSLNSSQTTATIETRNQRNTFKLTHRKKKKSEKLNSVSSVRNEIDGSCDPSSPGLGLSPSARNASRKKIRDELSRIFEAYRVDTVICSFEPQTCSAAEAGVRSNERVQDEVQFGLDEAGERRRIENMERVVLESCLQSGVVGRLALTVHSASTSSSPLTPPPASSVRPHLLYDNDLPRPRISITEFRWGFLMNELASEECLVDGATAENGLGRYLLEPGMGPNGRWIIDFEHKRARLPTFRSVAEIGKGKQKPEPVCFTLAEDVARFVGLACKLREAWDWNTGKMVGDTARGGWEEVVDMVERISRSKLEREYFRVLPSAPSGGTESSSDSTSSKSSMDQRSSTLPISSEEGSPRESAYKFEDRLRGRLAEEGQDASSVRLAEFVRVWFTPLAQPPAIKIDGSRVRKSQRATGRHRNPPNGHLPIPQPVEQKEWLKAPEQINPGRQNVAPVDGPARSNPGAAGQASPRTVTGLVSNPLPLPTVTQNGAFNGLLSPPAQQQKQLTRGQQEGPMTGNPNSDVNQFNFVPKVIVPFSNTLPARQPNAGLANSHTNSFMRPLRTNSVTPLGPRAPNNIRQRSLTTKGVNSEAPGGTGNFVIRRSPLATRVA